MVVLRDNGRGWRCGGVWRRAVGGGNGGVVVIGAGGGWWVLGSEVGDAPLPRIESALSNISIWSRIET